MLTLYYAKGTVALAPHIILEEAAALYESQEIKFADNEQRHTDYLRINPKGRVPALVTPEGILTEAPALLTYIAQSYPEKNLIPSDTYGFAKAQEFMSFMASTVHVSHAHRIRGIRWTDNPEAIEALKLKVAQNMHDHFSLIQETYFKGPWLMGEQFTVCDAYLFTVSRWLANDGVNINDFPKISEHTVAMKERVAVQRVFSLHDLL